MLTASKSMIDAKLLDESKGSETIDSIVAACRQGDQVAAEILYDRLHQPTYRLLVRLVGVGYAEDLLQQVFLQVFRSLKQFNGQSRFETWLYRVAVNESLQHLRKQKQRRQISLESDLMDERPDHERNIDSKELMERALARLEPELRSLFLLREIEKQSYAEIATVMQIPEGTVASRLSRARQLLKEYLLEMGWEE